MAERDDADRRAEALVATMQENGVSLNERGQTGCVTLIAALDINPFTTGFCP